MANAMSTAATRRFREASSDAISVIRFVEAMARKLEVNSHKTGWRTMTPVQLLRRLKQEVRELERAVRTDKHPDLVVMEAADVGNFAMMVADAVRFRADGGDPSDFDEGSRE
jgi:NTP pyrophosphatase (non-canonical NTP hydrolase)